MFEDWKFSIYSDLFTKFLKPLFLADARFIVEFFKCYMKPELSLSAIFNEIRSVNMYDMLAAIQSRNELYRVSVLFGPIKDIAFIEKTWKSQLQPFKEVGNHRTLESLLKFRFQVATGRQTFPISEAERNELLKRLKRNYPNLNSLELIALESDEDSKTAMLRSIAWGGDYEMFLNLNSTQKFTDKKLVDIVKTASIGKHWSIAEKAAEGLENKLYADEEGNTVHHLIPLYRSSFELFQGDKRKLLWGLFGLKNRDGIVAFEVQLHFHKNYGVGLFIQLIKFMPFDQFLAALEMIETLRPGYFESIIIPKFGALLLSRARKYDYYEFFLMICKISADSKIVYLYGDVYSPISIALCCKKTSKKSIALLITGIRFDETELGTKFFCKLMAKKQFVPSKKWINLIFHDSNAVFTVLREFVRLRQEDCALNFLCRASCFDHLKLSSTQLSCLAAQAHQFELYDLFRKLLKNGSVDFNYPINQKGYCIIDALLGSMKLKSSDLDIVKKFDLSRIIRLRNPDGTFVFGKKTSFPGKKRLILEAFQNFKSIVRFGPNALRYISELKPNEALGSSDVCAICKCNYEEAEVPLFSQADIFFIMIACI